MLMVHLVNHLYQAFMPPSGLDYVSKTKQLLYREICVGLLLISKPGLGTGSLIGGAGSSRVRTGTQSKAAL